MKIKFIPGQNLVANKSFNIFDDDIYIGSVEGAGSKYGEFITVIKLNPKYHGRGIGFQAFEKIFTLINQNYPITTIKASWHKNDEFKDFENGMSTNLMLFQNNLSTLSPQKSALATPTGKWASKLGFVNCDIISQSVDEVIVHFTK